jgi:three-Cys-motif partner protein
MASKRILADNQPVLIELPEAPSEKEVKFKRLSKPIWTENKAKLIERYLYYFVLITRHGTYIDGFAGPQEEDKPEMWAAKLVLENKPAWLRHFYLYDSDPEKHRMLEELKAGQPTHDSKGKKIPRSISVKCGDSNVLIPELLSSSHIKQKEATFCLLDQRTFECHWATVEALAKYKDPGFPKIELFYFLPNAWQDRALAALTVNKQDAINWWGHGDVEMLRRMSQDQRRDTMCTRMKKDLGYKHVHPWPIYEKDKGKGAVMYYMIHASDHDEAPKLMQRAYHNALKVKESLDELPCLFPGMYNLDDLDN